MSATVASGGAASAEATRHAAPWTARQVMHMTSYTHPQRQCRVGSMRRDLQCTLRLPSRPHLRTCNFRDTSRLQLQVQPEKRKLSSACRMRTAGVISCACGRPPPPTTVARATPQGPRRSQSELRVAGGVQAFDLWDRGGVRPLATCARRCRAVVYAQARVASARSGARAHI